MISLAQQPHEDQFVQLLAIKLPTKFCRFESANMLFIARSTLTTSSRKDRGQQSNKQLEHSKHVLHEKPRPCAVLIRDKLKSGFRRGESLSMGHLVSTVKDSLK